MVKLVTIDTIQTIIKEIGIGKFFRELIAELTQDFARWNEFKKMPRVASHVPNGVIELMPIYDEKIYSFKYVNGHPHNPMHDKLTVVAMGLLADVHTGYPLMISEMTLLTAMRTAATAALAASYLAKQNAQTLGIIGTGAQAEFLILAHDAALGIKQIRYFDLDLQAMGKLAHNLQKYQFDLKACKGAQETIRDADIIITATAARKTARVLENEWVMPGVHINGIGGDCPGKTELDPDILTRSKVVVEYLPQTSLEGEIQNMPLHKVYAELWEIISGAKKARENDHEITLFDSVGFALEDYSILKLIYRLANELKLGETINLIPDLKNPKDLFGLLG